MRSEVGKGKVLLRWAPTDAKAWQQLNKYGVGLERLTVARDGKVLDQPETRILYDCLKPVASDEFKQIAAKYDYGAIIAQAIFGESFVVTGPGKKGDVASLLALSEERQQRFAMSLYAADLCFPAALVVGWGWEDDAVKENERYLYRVVPLVPPKEMDIAAGALFVDPTRIDRFPAPLDFAAQFMDGSALLGWNYRTLGPIYNAYIPERSTDGVDFAPIAETPVTKMDTGTGERVVYADSIQNGVKYYYRLRGVTPFGSYGEYSDTLSGMGHPELQAAPFITRAAPDDKGGASIEWTIDPASEDLVESFTLERSDDDKKYADLVTHIDRKERSVTVKDIPPTNYFVVAALGASGRRMRSFSALVQPIDSIPPAVPSGLAALADTSGVVRLSWRANTESDIYGYRIYRGQTKAEELVPLNDVAVRDTVFVDSLDIRSLNSKVYYAITSLDKRYNQSDKCAVVEVVKPEVIPPTPPFIRHIAIENGRNVLQWASGQEENLAGYDIRRKAGGEEEFSLLAAVDGAANCTYEDPEVENNKTYVYRVCSRSIGGLRSDPSPDYEVTALNRTAAPASPKSAPTLAASVVDGRIRLSWKVPAADVVSVQLYRKTGDGALSLMRDQLPSTGQLDDAELSPGVKYQYMLVVKTNGAPPQTAVKEVGL